MRTTGEMQVHRLLDHETGFFEVFAEGLSGTLGVSGGVFAAAAARAGYDTAGGAGRLGGETEVLQLATGRGDQGVGHVGDDHVLPDGQAQFAFAKVGGEGR